MKSKDVVIVEAALVSGFAAAFMLNTKDETAFGPVLDGMKEAMGFISWLDKEPQAYGDDELTQLLVEYRGELWDIHGEEFMEGEDDQSS